MVRSHWITESCRLVEGSGREERNSPQSGCPKFSNEKSRRRRIPGRYTGRI